jgi:uncharacterized protein YybS (DUF2232 family)
MQKSTKALSESALITTIICIAGISAMYLPLVSLLVFFTFVPLIVLGKKHGFKYASISLVASSLIIGMFAGPVYAISLILLLGSPSLIMGWLLNIEKSTSTIIGAGTVAALISMVLLIAFSQMVTGIPLFESIKTIFDESVKMQESMFASIGTDPAKIELMMKSLNQTREQIMLIVPGAFVAWSVITTLLNYYLALKILKRTGVQVPYMAPFRELVLPRNIMMGTIIIYLLSLIASYLNIVDPDVLMANVQILIIYTYAIQGIAVVLWYMHRRKTMKLVQILIVTVVLLSSIGTMIFFMIGVTEVAFSIRKRTIAKDDNNQKKLG